MELRYSKNNINDILKRKNNTILLNNDISEKYKKTMFIDYLFELNELIICITDNSNINISQNKILNFINSVTEISSVSSKKCIGLYISKELNQEYKDYFNSVSILDRNNKFINIQNNDKKIVHRELISYLYDNSIYLYDNDNCCVMIDSESNRLLEYTK